MKSIYNETNLSLMFNELYIIKFIKNKTNFLVHIFFQKPWRCMDWKICSIFNKFNSIKVVEDKRQICFIMY